jgi:hypothetical protein
MTKRGLLIGTLVVHIVAPISSIGFGYFAVPIGCPIGHLIAASLVLGHFISLGNYKVQLEADIEWLEQGGLDLISECTESSAGIPTKDDFMRVLYPNLVYARNLYGSLYFWLISCAVVPAFILSLIFYV